MKKKILMLLDSEFPPDIRVENEAVSLIEAGFEVHVLCFAGKNIKSTQTFKGINIHRRKINKFTYKSAVGCLDFPFYFNFWRKFANKLFAAHKFDFIHIHDLRLAKIGMELKTKNNIPLVLDLHENFPELLRISEHTKTFLGKVFFKPKKWKKYESEAVQSADAVIAVVDESKKRIVELGACADRVFVVSNTIKYTESGDSKLQRDAAHFTLLYAGGIIGHRGLKNVLYAAQIAKDKVPGLMVKIIGGGKDLENLKRQSSVLQLNKVAEFTGWLSQDQVYKELFKADAAIIPHMKSEHTDSTIPHKLFHYMYAKLPVIASDCVPLERIIKETGTGMAYKHNDAGELAECIKYLYDNEDIRHSYGEKGRKAVLKKYNWTHDEKVLVRLYKEMS